MADLIIDKAWSYIGPGEFIRWVTPRFVKYGHVIERSGPSMLVKFIEDDRPRALPDARWYFVEGKRTPMNEEEHLVMIDYKAWYNSDGPSEPFVPTDNFLRLDNLGPGWITTEAACEMLNWDPKKLRRYIRRGHILARKKDDRWEVNREALRERASKQGWV